MSRQERPDLRPTVFLPDTGSDQQIVNEVLGQNRRARVRVTGQRFERFITVYEAMDQRLDDIRRTTNPPLDEKVLNVMLSRCAQARTTMLTGVRQPPDTPIDQVAHRFQSVGCRVHMTQKQIADIAYCSRDHVSRQIQILREHGIIVNWGRGWYEFDALFVWRGDYELRNAYLDVQRHRQDETESDPCEEGPGTPS